MLGQLRDGFSGRPHAFPFSIALCGRVEVGQYRAFAGDDHSGLETASPFSLAVEPLRVGNFSLSDVGALYRQHAQESGQEFAPEAVEQAFGYTQGQPWLVNALAGEATGNIGSEPAGQITASHIDAAKERLILSMVPDRGAPAILMGEISLQPILEPLIAGRLSEEDDKAIVSILRHFGMVAPDRPVQVANPIYREAIVQWLASRPANPPSLVLPDGRLDLPRLMDEYVTSAEQIPGMGGWYSGFALMNHLRRRLNDDGHLDPPTGNGSISVLVTNSHGADHLRHTAVEYKVWRKGRPDPLPVALRQLDRYLHRHGLDASILVIVDSRPEAAPVRERSSITTVRGPSGRDITVLRA